MRRKKTLYYYFIINNRYGKYSKYSADKSYYALTDHNIHNIDHYTAFLTKVDGKSILAIPKWLYG